MKTSMLTITVVLALTTAACNTMQERYQARRPFNAWAVESVTDGAINQAIIAQGTLFPYHFDPRAETLNHLGKHDLAVLAEYYREHPGQLSLPRGSLSDGLYERRVATVATALAQSGVQKDRISIANALPGGSGMPSERVVVILENEATQPAATLAGSIGSTSQKGGS